MYTLTLYRRRCYVTRRKGLSVYKCVRCCPDNPSTFDEPSVYRPCGFNKFRKGTEITSTAMEFLVNGQCVSFPIADGRRS